MTDKKIFYFFISNFALKVFQKEKLVLRSNIFVFIQLW